MPSTSRLSGSPVHREISSSKHHEPSRSGSTRRSDSSSSKHHEPSRSSSTRDGRSNNKFDGHRGTVTRLHGPSKLSAISETPENITSIPRFRHEGDDRTLTRSSRHHADDHTVTRFSRHRADDRTETHNHHTDDRRRSWTTRNENYDSQQTIRPSDSVTRASDCNSYMGTLVRCQNMVHSFDPTTRDSSSTRTLELTRTPSTRDSSSTRTLELTRASSTRGGYSTRPRESTRPSSTRGSSSTSSRERELEKRIERLESSKAKALERKVEDLERKLENMHVDNAIQRRAMRNAYYREESKRISDYALSLNGEAYYLHLLKRVDLSRYL